MSTTHLDKDLIFILLQYLKEENYSSAMHQLEQESGVFFNLKYFEELILSGNWDEAEKYLLSFTKIDENRYSTKTFFEIRKQKYLEALDKLDRAKAVDILLNDLKVFAVYNEELYKELTLLLILDDFRKNDKLSGYKDTNSRRTALLTEIKKLIGLNPIFRDKLEFPNVKTSRLHVLINQSLNWQRVLCGNSRHDPDVKTLFQDHSCRRTLGELYNQLPVPNNQLVGSALKSEAFPQLLANGPRQDTAAQTQIPISTWIPNIQPHAPVGISGFGPFVSSNPVPNGSAESLRTRLSRFADGTKFAGSSSNQSNLGLTSPDLPTTVSRTLDIGSEPTSMDFHPIQQTILLIGTRTGDFSLWEVSSKERLVSWNFQVWTLEACSLMLKESICKDASISVKRVLWSTDGSFLGVAYSKHMVQLFRFHGRKDIQRHLEIEAHIGSVNDIAFASPNKLLNVITCGDDKTIKVWDVVRGVKLYTLEGHEASVYSVCPHLRDNIHFLFSTSVDGKIKVWLYDTNGPRINFDAPGGSSAVMVYSADGKRLFSCGTAQNGESHLVEWVEHEGTIKRTYQGLRNQSSDIRQCDTSKNKFLVVGDDHLIKFWDMNDQNLLTSVAAEGNLSANPRIRFNKDGVLLAVSTNDNRVKILATADGLNLMRTSESNLAISSRLKRNSDSQEKNADDRQSQNKKSRLEEGNGAQTEKQREINNPNQLQSLQLCGRSKLNKIAKISYTNSGTGIIALTFNGTNLLWKWPRNDQNQSIKATTKVIPSPLRSSSGAEMINDLTNAKPEEAEHCFSISKNDSYIVSSSGGKVSLFNILTFKTLTNFMSPPPSVTSIAFYPEDNNVIAAGMSDARICIYNIRMNKVKYELQGHTKKVTGLAFSTVLKTLASSSADGQIITWGYGDNWEVRKTLSLSIQAEQEPSSSKTKVQFHEDQIHLLAVHDSLLAIYEAQELKIQKQWIVPENDPPISDATFSCDGRLVFAAFCDGTLRIFNASELQTQLLIDPRAYVTSDIFSSLAYPHVIAANPQGPNQFVAALTDGQVYVFEPLEAEGKWDVNTPEEEGLANNTKKSASPVIDVDALNE